MKLSQIAMIPILIQSTLDTVTDTFDSLSTSDSNVDPSEILSAADQNVDENNDNATIEQVNGRQGEAEEPNDTSNDSSQFESFDRLPEEDVDSNIDEVVLTPPPSPDLEYNEKYFERNEKQLKV